MKTHKIFVLPASLYLALLVANVALSLWLFSETDSIWVLNDGQFKSIYNLSLLEIAGILQTALLALTVDMSIRSAVGFLNERKKHRQIPAVIVQFVILISYGLIGLYTYVTIYDKSYTNLIAASGIAMVGLALQD